MPAPMPDQITEKLDADKPPNKAAFAGCAQNNAEPLTSSDAEVAINLFRFVGRRNTSKQWENTP